MKWLPTEWILSVFADRKGQAIERYQEFVAVGRSQPCPWGQLKNQIYLGSEGFVEKMQANLDAGKDLSEIPAQQRRAPVKPLEHYATQVRDRDAAITAAYASGGYSMKEIGDYFGLHYSYVSRIINRAGKARDKT